MTLQRMAREDSTETRIASAEFKLYVHQLSLTKDWTEYTWNGNTFDAALIGETPQIRYKEYKTENVYGVYRFDKSGKLGYALCSKIPFALQAFGYTATAVIAILIFIGCPIAGNIIIMNRLNLIVGVLLIGIPFILGIIANAAKIFDSVFIEITMLIDSLIIGIPAFAAIISIFSYMEPCINTYISQHIIFK